MGLGEDLRRARETAGFTLEDINRRTRIPKKYLEALEEEAFQTLPAPVYVRTFLRAYAKAVGLDPLLVIRQYRQEIQEEEPPLLFPKEEQPPWYRRLWGKRPKNFGRAWEAPQEEEWDEAADEKKVSLQVERDPSLRPRRPFPGALAPAALLLAAAVAAGAWWWNLEEKKGVSRTEASKSVGSPARKNSKEDVLSSYTPTGEQYLVLKGLDLSWVLVKMDDQASSEVILDPGEIKLYRAEKNFTVRLGNAGGVDIQWNGKPLGVLGAVGEVVEITLPMEKP